MRVFSIIAMMALALPALAQELPPIPLPRPDREAVPVVVPDAEAVPETAPVDEAAPEADSPPTEPEVAAPPPEPKVNQTACAALLSGQVEGELLPPIAENQCGERSPMTITGVLVNGSMVPLTSPVTIGCAMATELPGWAAAVDGYLQARENTGIESIITGTGYMCRNVNGAETGNLSEHAFADAMDVVGFTLGDGRSIAVETGWGDALSDEGRLLRFAHDAACSRFMTTLGPEANAEHFDHLHLDMGCHGKSCTARLCE